jgi:hypothetical protein
LVDDAQNLCSTEIVYLAVEQHRCPQTKDVSSLHTNGGNFMSMVAVLHAFFICVVLHAFKTMWFQ